MNPFFHRFSYATLLLAALFVAAGCGTRTTEEIKGPTGQDKAGNPKDPDLTSVAPKFTMTAVEFGEEYKKDKKAADEKFKNEVIELSGKVVLFGRNIGGQSYLSLEFPKEITGIMVFPTEKEPWAKVSPGQQIKVKGKYPEFSISPSLLHCVLTEVGNNPAPALTADQLAKEFTADKEATKKKYDDQWLIIEGEMIDTGTSKSGTLMLRMKGTDKMAVECFFPPDFKDDVAKLKAGQKVKVIGKGSIFTQADDKPGLDQCHLITGGK